MEVLLKLVVSLLVVCLIYYQVIFVRTLWKSQIDPVATFSRLLDKLKPETSVLATRDPMKIYQGGQVLGEVHGDVKRDSNRVIFQELVNTTGLNLNQPIEYQRLRLRILSTGPTTGEVQDMTDKGTFVYRDVIARVECEILP